MGRLPDKLIELLGANRKAPVNISDLVPKWDGAEEYTSVEAIYRDLLGNECWITRYTWEEHIPKELEKKGYKQFLNVSREKLREILEQPEIIVYDWDKDAFLYGSRFEGLLLFVVVGKDSRKIFTLIPRKNIFKNTRRFEVIYEKDHSSL